MIRNILLLESKCEIIGMLKNILNGLGKNLSVFCAQNFHEAYLFSLKTHIHIFIIDIVIDSDSSMYASGLRFAEEIRNIKHYAYTPMIFLSKYEDPCLYSFKSLHCYDFIEMPFSEERIISSLKNVLSLPPPQTPSKHIYLKKDGCIYPVAINEIIYVESSRRRIDIYSTHQTLAIPNLTISNILSEINSTDFIQCSRFVAINLNYIEYIDYVNRYIKLKSLNNPVEIGAVMKKTFFEQLHIHQN